MIHSPHNASYQPQPDGEYLIVCDRCPLRKKARMSRNEAHDIAYLHTTNPGA